MKPEQRAALISALEAAVNWFAAVNDGEEGCNYLNGDSDVYPGDGQEDGERIGRALADCYADLVNSPEHSP